METGVRKIWVITDGRAGNAAQALGVANNGVGYSDYLFTGLDLTGWRLARVRGISKLGNLLCRGYLGRTAFAIH